MQAHKWNRSEKWLNDYQNSTNFAISKLRIEGRREAT